jgi:hypothetical protein
MNEEDMEYERNVEIYRLKRLIAKLDSMKG